MDDDVPERHLAHQLETGEDHPVLPEADDVARRRVQVARIEGAQIGRVVRPAQSRERPERRREPGVEDVLAPSQLARAALGARFGLGPPARSSGRPGTPTAAADAPTRSAARCSSRAPPRARLIANRCWDSGWNRTRPSRSASSAGCFRSPIAHHHCIEMRGSIRDLQRSQSATVCRYDSRFSSCSCSRSHSRIRSSASSWRQSGQLPASSFIRPPGPITVSSGRPWSRPIS